MVMNDDDDGGDDGGDGGGDYDDGDGDDGGDYDDDGDDGDKDLRCSRAPTRYMMHKHTLRPVRAPISLHRISLHLFLHRIYVLTPHSVWHTPHFFFSGQHPFLQYFSRSNIILSSTFSFLILPLFPWPPLFFSRPSSTVHHCILRFTEGILHRGSSLLLFPAFPTLILMFAIVLTILVSNMIFAAILTGYQTSSILQYPPSALYNL